MKIFKIDFRKFLREKIPTFLRKSEILLCMLDAIARGLMAVYRLFTDFRNEVLRKQSYNYQVCYLEAMLNDTFDKKFRRIYITDMEVREFLMIYKKEEDRPVMISQNGIGNPVMIHRLEEIDIRNAFVVNIPSELNSQTNKIHASVDMYKLASVEFVIKTF